VRRENDFYPTPGWATRELLKRQEMGGYIVEPCNGDGDITRELDQAGLMVMTNDLDRNRQAASHEDATDWRFWDGLSVCHWVVSNPPFSVADKIVPMAFRRATMGVAMLLRISYLEPCEGRGAWLAMYPPTRLIVLPRISFTGDGNTDLATCAWYVWERGARGQQITVVNPRDERQGCLLGQESADAGYGHGV